MTVAPTAAQTEALTAELARVRPTAGRTRTDTTEARMVALTAVPAKGPLTAGRTPVVTTAVPMVVLTAALTARRRGHGTPEPLVQ